MNVAVTGANGHVGANLVRALLARGDRVRALVHRDTRALAGLDVERVPADVLDPATLRPAFAGMEGVYHLAALISITGSQSGRVEHMNVEGAHNVARAAREAGVGRLVHLSSVHAFHHEPGERLDEASPRPRASDPAYDRSKAAGEVAVRNEVAAGLDAVILNPTGILGPFDFGPSRFGKALLDFASGRMPVAVRGGFDWVDVRDVAQACIAAMERGRRGEGYLVGGRWASIAEIGALVAAATGGRPPWVALPMGIARAVAPLGGWVQARLGQEPTFTPEAMYALARGSRHVDVTKARTELGHTPRPLEDTVRDTLDWFRRAGMA